MFLLFSVALAINLEATNETETISQILETEILVSPTEDIEEQNSGLKTGVIIVCTLLLCVGIASTILMCVVRNKQGRASDEQPDLDDYMIAQEDNVDNEETLAPII